MGGQACVLYGAAEFSRDLDLCVLADPANLELLRSALADLQAEVIAVPSFDQRFLEKGMPFTSVATARRWREYASTS